MSKLFVKMPCFPPLYVSSKLYLLIYYVLCWTINCILYCTLCFTPYFSSYFSHQSSNIKVTVCSDLIFKERFPSCIYYFFFAVNWIVQSFLYCTVHLTVHCTVSRAVIRGKSGLHILFRKLTLPAFYSMYQHLILLYTVI